MTSKILRADGTTYLSAIKSVVYHESVNADTDLRPGCVSSSYIEVECYGAQSDAPAVGEALKYYQTVNGTDTLIGIFYAEPSIPTKNSYKFVAYDAINKLDADFSAWLSANQANFPYTVYQLVSQACSIAGVTLGSSSWSNSTMSVNAFSADGITCRNILQYAAEIGCKFARCHTNGSVYFEWYTTASNKRIYPSSGTSGSETRYAYKQDGLTYENYNTSAVARVAVHPVGEDDVAYYYPANVQSGNTLNITNNAFLYGASSANMTTIAQTIYNALTSLGVYRPMSVEMFPNECPLNAGQKVAVTDAQNVSFTTLVMEKTVTDSAVTLTSTGREVYGDYALDTAKQLVQLAADIVRINKLKVDWAEIGTAIVDTLEATGINADWINAGAFTVKDAQDNIVFEASQDERTAQISNFVASSSGLSSVREISGVESELDINHLSGDGHFSITYTSASGGTVTKYFSLSDTISISSLQNQNGFIIGGNGTDIVFTSSGIYFCSAGQWQVKFNGASLELAQPSYWREALEIFPVRITGTVYSGYVEYTDSRIQSGMVAALTPEYSRNTGAVSYIITAQCTTGKMYVYLRDYQNNRIPDGTNVQIAGIISKI